MESYQNTSQELGIYNTGGDQWEVLTEEEAISRGLLNTDRSLNLSQNQKIAIGVTTAALVAGGGYLLYKYYNKMTGREVQEVLSEEDAARKGLSNGQKIIIGAAAAAAVAFGGYFLYRYYNPQTGREEEKMLTNAEARGLGLSDAHKVQGGGGTQLPIAQGQNVPYGQQPAYGQPQYGQQPYIPTQSGTYMQQPAYAQPQYGQQPYNPAQSAPPTYMQQPAYGQPQYGQQSYNPAQSMPMQGQYPPQQQQQYSGNDASMKKEFDMLDVNKTGYIDKEDLQKIFMGKVSGTVLKMAIKYVDKDKDGKIGFDEYKKIRSKLMI